MEKIKSYINEMVKVCEDRKAEMQEHFANYLFEDFLSTKAEKCHKNEMFLSFYKTIQSSLDENTKGELIEYLASEKDRYVTLRLKNNPINFTTNPMTNLVRLWNFEVYAELIKHIDTILFRYC